MWERWRVMWSMRMSCGVKDEQNRCLGWYLSTVGFGKWLAQAVVSQFPQTMKSTTTAHNSCKARLDTGRYLGAWRYGALWRPAARPITANRCHPDRAEPPFQPLDRRAKLRRCAAHDCSVHPWVLGTPTLALHHMYSSLPSSWSPCRGCNSV